MSISGDYITCKGKNKSGNWCHRLRWRKYEGAKQQEKNFTRPTKIASKRAAQDFLESLRRGEVGDNSSSFASLVNKWEAERKVTCKLGTLAEYQRLREAYITPAFGDRKDVASITPMDIQDFNQKLINNGKSSNIRIQVLTLLRGIFAFGVRNHLLRFDPTTAIRKPRPKTRDVYVLTSAQRNALLASASDKKYQMLFALAMFTGLRQGELLGLRWSSIDFERGVIVVREQFTSGHTDTPKGNKTREVPFDNNTSDWLEGWRSHTGGGELVFPAANGKEMDAKNMCQREWRPALVRSGIKAEIEAAGHPSFRFHDLRHVFASVLLDKGASLHDLKRLLGHASVTTTETHYAHLVPGFHDRLRDRVGDLTDGVELDMGRQLSVVG